jgi:glutaconate CoA-transferase subunit A
MPYKTLWESTMTKLCSLADAAALVQDGQAISTSGSLLHRAPSAFLREICRGGRKGLTLIKPSPGFDADLLCAAGALERVMSGIVTFEARYGLAPNYRKAIEKGLAGLTEHA